MNLMNLNSLIRAEKAYTLLLHRCMSIHVRVLEL